MNNLLKADRLNQTKGLKGWAVAVAVLGVFCADQFLFNVPYENLIFPLLVICAATMSFSKNFAVIAVYSLLFELSCVAWIPTRLADVKWWLLEVFIGFFMPYLVYKACNPKHKNISVFLYALFAALGQILYFWVSVFATALIYKLPLITYWLNDAVFELKAAAVTYLCALPIAAIYKLVTGELSIKVFKRRKNV